MPLTKPSRGSTFNRSHPLAQGLAGWWILWEGTGGMAYDISGNRNDGTLTNMDPSTDWISGRAGWALDFDGTNDYVSLDSHVNDYSSNTTGTVTAWFKRNGTTNRDVVLSFGESTTDDRFILEMDVSGAATLRVVIREASSNLVDIEAGNIDDMNWHHAAVTSDDGSEAKLYLDGVDITPVSPTANGNHWFSDVTGKNRLRIGSDNRQNGNVHMNGRIDDVRIYNRALSPAQIRQLYLDPWASFRRPKIQRVFVPAVAVGGAQPSTLNRIERRVLRGVGRGIMRAAA